MGVKLSDFKTDKEKTEAGVWVDIGEGAAVKVARNGNKKHSKIVDELRKPYRSYELARKAIPEDVLRKIMNEATAKAILVDWRGLLDDNNKEIPFTYDAALEALQNDDFFSMILGFSNDSSLFRVAQEDEVKNSQTPSVGSLPAGGAV